MLSLRARIVLNTRRSRQNKASSVLHLSESEMTQNGMARPGSGVSAREEWSYAVATRLQRAIGELLDTDRNGFAAAIQRLIAELPEPLGPADRADLSRRLMQFTARIGRSFHAGHHLAGPVPCGFAPLEACTEVWFDAETSPRALLARWLSVFTESFDRHHPVPAAQRAARILSEHPTGGQSIASLARAAGVSKSVLLRQFAQCHGMPPTEYRTRIRLLRGLQVLHMPGTKVSEAARQAGYRSPKNFNAAMKKYVGHTPSEARRLSSDELHALIRQRLSGVPS